MTATRGMLDRLTRPLRRMALAVLGTLRRMPAGRAAARLARRHAPGAYAWVLGRYHAYGQMAVAPRRRSTLGPTATPPEGISAQERLVFQRLALAARLARPGR